MTEKGFPIFAISFILMGFSIFASSLFTALSDGVSSAIISFARTFLFLVGAILILPSVMGEIGLWLAVPVAEAFGVIVAIVFVIRKKKTYF